MKIVTILVLSLFFYNDQEVFIFRKIIISLVLQASGIIGSSVTCNCIIHIPR
jgi:hypothetical protein